MQQQPRRQHGQPRCGEANGNGATDGEDAEKDIDNGTVWGTGSDEVNGNATGNDHDTPAVKGNGQGEGGAEDEGGGEGEDEGGGEGEAEGGGPLTGVMSA